ncbi:MAG: ABC transporter ATP-binding protein [Actinomycetota bacterium]|nr:ABC transporter ATP-binding protein [Actinomycetota bacterium]
MPAVRARSLHKSFGRGRAQRQVLAGADLDVAPGELVAVLGRSGSGKSTLLHLLGGLDRPDGGEIWVGEEPVHDRGERALADLRRRRVGFVFQSFHLIPELSGEDNALLPARLPGAGARVARRGGELIDRLGLREVADHLPHELSGGEQQRFALVRALAADPELVLADEPTGNLDSASAAGVLELVRALAGDDRSVVLVTHDPRAAAIADRVLELRDGRLAG